MKLSEYIKNAPEGILYHIGSGSGFLMIVTKDEFVRDLEHWENRHFTANKTSITIGLSQIRDIWLIKADEQQMRAIKARRAKLFNQMRKKIDKIENWMPIADRKVKDTYNRLAGGKCVIIEGDENGDFRYREEYEKWMAENGATEVEG